MSEFRCLFVEMFMQGTANALTRAVTEYLKDAKEQFMEQINSIKKRNEKEEESNYIDYLMHLLHEMHLSSILSQPKI